MKQSDKHCRETRSDDGVSRRDFLRSAAGAAAGGATIPIAAQTTASVASTTSTASIVSTQPEPAAPSASRRKIRLGVVGGGFGAEFHWHEHPDCIVHAVSDLRPERRKRLSEAYQCDRQYESLEKLILDREIDAVAVFTGGHDHVRHTIACLDAGKHVCCAVPAAMSIDECDRLLAAVKKSGLTYMLAETTWWHQSVITARQWYRQGLFGNIFFTEAEYHHPGYEEYFFDDDGRHNWRWGLPPMLYPTHCTGYLVAVTGERLTRVSCTGWGDGSPELKGNPYGNAFWNETAFFTTDRGNSLRAAVYWRGPLGLCERGQWYGEKTSFFDPSVNGTGPIVRRRLDPKAPPPQPGHRPPPRFEKFDQPQHWQTDMLPEPLRHTSPHDCSQPFITHEFIDCLVRGRQPETGVYEALAMNVPGIIAHQSALDGGRQLEIPVYKP